MRYHYGNTVCISSQVGCRQGCAFCASTIGGLVRNLTPSEMLDEVLFINQGKVTLQASVDDIRQQYGMSVDEYFREVFKC